MLPISEIYVGDQYENPLFRPNGVTYVVVAVDKTTKMVKVQAVNPFKGVIGKPFWRRNTDRMFSEDWRVFCGKELMTMGKFDEHEMVYKEITCLGTAFMLKETNNDG